MRKQLIDILKEVGEVRVLSNRKGTIKKPTIILQRKLSMSSITNSRSLFVYWDVLCYVPQGSMIALDEFVDKVTNQLLKNKIELSNSFSGDYFDDELQAYMRFIEIRIPETTIKEVY